MITRISIDKFKVYRTPQTINFAPLTLVVGVNNSGKSTLLDAVRIIASGFGHMKEDWADSEYLSQSELPHLDFAKNHLSLEAGTFLEVESNDLGQALSYLHSPDDPWLIRSLKDGPSGHDTHLSANQNQVLNIPPDFQLEYFLPLLYCLFELRTEIDSAAIMDLSGLFLEADPWHEDEGGVPTLQPQFLSEDEYVPFNTIPVFMEMFRQYGGVEASSRERSAYGSRWLNFYAGGDEDSPFHRMLRSAASDILEHLRGRTHSLEDSSPENPKAWIAPIEKALLLFQEAAKGGGAQHATVTFSDLCEDDLEEFWSSAATSDFFAQANPTFKELRFGRFQNGLRYAQLGGDTKPFDKQFYLPGEEKPDPKNLKELAQDLHSMGLDSPNIYFARGDKGIHELRINHGNADHPLKDLGLGLRRLIPMFLGLSAQKASIIMLEEPEAHLHQGAQADLGDLLLHKVQQTHTSRSFNFRWHLRKQWLVETHSPHLIYRILRRIRETTTGTLPEGAPKAKPENVSILCVERNLNGEPGSFVRPLRIGSNGELLDPLPPDFFEASLSDRMKGWADK